MCAIYFEHMNNNNRGTSNTDTYLQFRVLGVPLDGLHVALRSASVVTVGQLPAGRVVVPRFGIVHVVRGEAEEAGLRSNHGGDSSMGV